MSKFRAAVMAIVLTAMFFIPMTAIPKEAMVQEITPQSSSQSVSSEAEEQKEPIPDEPISEKEETFRIFDLETEKVEEVSYSDYVKGAIASEMGASFEFEALVAQGVAAFSCGLHQKEAHAEADYDFSAAPGKKLGYITGETAKEIYGTAFEEKWEIIEKAAKTAMEYVVVYEGKPALTVYHAMSNGKTESSGNAWRGALPYLISVESKGDIFSPDYKSTVTVKKEDALEILNSCGARLNGKAPGEWFEGAVLTAAGYVSEIKIGAATFSGEKLRNLFNLRSSSFTVEYKDGEFVFTVKGYGHGVGLSQIGANYMAENGFDFKEILAHYYPNTELIKYSDLI